MDNLPLLRDIHLPEENFIFPLGYGWLLLLLFPIFIYAGYKTFKYLKSKSKKYYALWLLQNADTDTLESAIKISEVLRRICVLKYAEAVSLFGDDWIKFLNMHSKKNLTSGAANILVYAPYVKKDKKYSNKDYQDLRSYAKQWIGENL